jgi:plastocyanin
MRRFMLPLCLVCLLVFSGVACSKKKDTGFPPIPTNTETPCESDPSKDPVDVTEPILVGDNFFAPLQGRVKAGTEIGWIQCGTAPHTVTFDDAALKIDSHPDCPADTAKCMKKDEEFKATLPKAGSFHYYCKIHGSKGSDAGMAGTIVVT